MRESAAYLCTKMCVAACVCMFKKVPTSERCSFLELLYWTSVIRELMWEKWTKDFSVIALFVSNYKEIQAYIKQTKLPSLNVSSKITMKDCFFLCDNKTTARLLTCPIDCYKSGTAALFNGSPSPSIFLLCKYIIWLSGLWFQCRSINLQVSAWCLRIILAQSRAKGALTLMTPAGCQLCAGQASLGGWMVDSWIAGWAAGWVPGCKETTRSAFWQNTFCTLMLVCENVDVLKMVDMELKRLQRLPASSLSKAESQVLFSKLYVGFFYRCQETQSSTVTVRRFDIMAPSV